MIAMLFNFEEHFDYSFIGKVSHVIEFVYLYRTLASKPTKTNDFPIYGEYQNL